MFVSFSCLFMKSNDSVDSEFLFERNPFDILWWRKHIDSFLARCKVWNTYQWVEVLGENIWANIYSKESVIMNQCKLPEHFVEENSFGYFNWPVARFFNLYESGICISSFILTSLFFRSSRFSLALKFYSSFESMKSVCNIRFERI